MNPRSINVVKTHQEKGDATDIALLVSTSSKSEINIWDKSKIVDSLVKEANASLALANQIADAVEEKILDSNFGTVTTSIIRELIDLELIQRNLTMMHKKHSHLGLPMYDVEQIILNANKENSNTTHNPESINLTIAEAILKEFALRKVFNEDVALAHLMGDIHLHDLGFIVRPYTYMGDSVVLANKGGGTERLQSIKQLYEELPFEIPAEEGVWVKRPLNPVYVQDKDGEWTRIIQLTKKAKGSKQMLFVRTSDGKQQVITYDHPMITTEGVKPCAVLRKDDQLYTFDYQLENRGTASINLVEAFTATAVHGGRYSVWLEEELPWSQVQKEMDFDNVSAHRYKDGYIIPNRYGNKTPIIFPLTPELGWILGFYLARGRQNGPDLVFACKGEGKARLIENSKKLNIVYEQRRRQGWVVIRDCLIRDLFINVWKIGTSSRNKALPRELHTYSPEFIKAAVAGMIDGCGGIDGDFIYLRSSSATLINQLTYILLMLGFNPFARRPGGVSSVRPQNGKSVIQRYPVWCVAFASRADIDLPSLKYIKSPKPAGQSDGFQTGQAGVGKITHLEQIDIPDEYIYDITTESHTFLCNGIYSHNCGGHSLEYIKKYGLSLPNITSASKPAKHAEVLIGHVVKMASSLQAHYAGAIGWEAVNMFFAPFLVGRPYQEIRQLAQMLIFEFNQLAGARGSQTVFTDFNLYWNIPRHFRDTPATGPGGEYTGKTYAEYEKEAQDFLRAMFEVYLQGDALGKTFVFPKPLLHINEDFFNTSGWEEFLDLACLVASKQGITYFVFDRGDECTISQCCRLRVKLGEQDFEEAKTPEKMRFSALQNVTINLPRIAYKAQRNDGLLFAEINRTLELVAKAHLQKKKFVKSLLDLGESGPLVLLSASEDGAPYLRIDRLKYLAGLFGLNEMVQTHLGKQLHESDEALKFGLKVVSHMNLKCKQLSDLYGINIILEESPAESSGYRLAKLDMKYFPEQTKRVVKGSLDNDEYYYTNSIHVAVDASMDYIERVRMQSLFHPLIEAGALCHIWLGEHEPPPESIKNFVLKTFRNTQCAQIAFSPEFTVCNTCKTTSRGLLEICPNCGSKDIYGTTQIIDSSSKISTLNEGKIGELRERVRTRLEGRNGQRENTLEVMGTQTSLEH